MTLFKKKKNWHLDRDTALTLLLDVETNTILVSTEQVLRFVRRTIANIFAFDNISLY